MGPRLHCKSEVTYEKPLISQICLILTPGQTLAKGCSPVSLHKTRTARFHMEKPEENEREMRLEESLTHAGLEEPGSLGKA